jgi:hypothetical protein
MAEPELAKLSAADEEGGCMFLSDEDVAAWLNGLSHKEFIEFFYKHLAARRTEEEGGGGARIESRLALAEVRHIPKHGGGFRPPVVELLCTASRPDSDPVAGVVEGAPIKWRGECCGFQTGSWQRFAKCPICGGEVRDA